MSDLELPLSERKIRRQEQKRAKEAMSVRVNKIEIAAKQNEQRIPPTIKTPAAKPIISPRIEREKQQTLFADSNLVGTLPQINLLDPAQKSEDAGYSSESLEHLSDCWKSSYKTLALKPRWSKYCRALWLRALKSSPRLAFKVSRISGLAKDLARSMAVISVRVVEVIPGKSVVGIEIPNEKRDMVRLSEVLSSEAYDRSSSPLTLALGHDIAGVPTVADLARMPHLSGGRHHWLG